MYARDGKVFSLPCAAAGAIYGTGGDEEKEEGEEEVSTGKGKLPVFRPSSLPPSCETDKKGTASNFAKKWKRGGGRKTLLKMRQNAFSFFLQFLGDFFGA